jgi:hypothetical protein
MADLVTRTKIGQSRSAKLLCFNHSQRNFDLYLRASQSGARPLLGTSAMQCPFGSDALLRVLSGNISPACRNQAAQLKPASDSGSARRRVFKHIFFPESHYAPTMPS